MHPKQQNHIINLTNDKTLASAPSGALAAVRTLQYTVGILHTLQVTPYNVQCTLYTVHCTLFTVHCALYTLHCSLLTVHCSLFTVHCSLFSVHSTLFTVHCGLFAVHFTLFTVHCPGVQSMVEKEPSTVERTHTVIIQLEGIKHDTLHCTVLHYTALPCTALHFTTLY